MRSRPSHQRRSRVARRGGHARFQRQIVPTLAGALLALSAVPARAIDLGAYYDLGSDWTLRFDNTVKYSTAVRTASPSPQLLTLNTDDGDRNLRSGFISNRGDLLTQFDVGYRDYGLSASAAGWYDTVYNERNKNNSPTTANNFSTAFNDFTDATRTLHGRNLELLNAFVYGKETIASVPVSVRVGRQTSIWGESIFFGTNGIAYGQAPIDVIKAQSVPNTQFKELLLPVGQVTATAQLSPQVSLSGFYQFEWRETRIAASGSYFSVFDAIGDGAERLRFAPGAKGASLFRSTDLLGSAGDNYGLALRYRPYNDLDLGLYAVNYSDTQPFLYTAPGIGVNFARGQVGTFFQVYPRDIQAVAASASASFDTLNLAAELGARHNAPLQSSTAALTVVPGVLANNTDHPLYALGDTFHANASAIYVGPATAAWEALTWTSEVALAQVIDFTKNERAFDPTRRKTAVGLRTVFSPAYFQVLPGLDINLPIGLGWNFLGRAPTTSTFNNTGADRGGDINIGISGTYNAVWQGTLSYTRFIGPPSRNAFADRDFVSASIAYSF